MKIKTALLELNGNSNIGLFIVCNDKFAIIGNSVTQEVENEIKKVLNVEIYRMNLFGNDLVGIYLALNNEFLIHPPTSEINMVILKTISKKHEISLIEIEDRNNTFGNLVSICDKEVIISHQLKKLEKNFKKELGKKVIILKDSDYNLAGNIIKQFNGKYFVSQEIIESDIESIMKKVVCSGTINSGNNFISNGVIFNKFGALIGNSSSTIEIQNVFDFLNE